MMWKRYSLELYLSAAPFPSGKEMEEGACWWTNKTYKSATQQKMYRVDVAGNKNKKQ